MVARARQNSLTQLGVVAALLMFVFATLVGVVRGLDPFLIVQRVAVATIITGVTVSAAAACASSMLGRRKKSRA